MAGNAVGHSYAAEGRAVVGDVRKSSSVVVVLRKAAVV